jgi:hypothetical protein
MALSALVPEIVYVMCGARGETSQPALCASCRSSGFIAFEPDADEYSHLAAHSRIGFTYLTISGR